MAYPGNLYALVARDQHLTCVNDHNLNTKHDHGGTPNEKLHLDRTISRRFRTKRGQSKVESGLSELAAAVASPRLPVSPTGHPFRLGLGPSQRTLGANACRTSPSDYGHRLDHGMCEISSGHLEPCAMTEVRCVAKGGGCRPQARENELRMAKTLNARALSLRKQQGRSHAVWLLDGVVRSSKPFGKTRVSHLAVRSGRTNDQQAGGSVSRGVATSYRVQCYSRGQAEHLGVPVMPRNPFRDEMSRSRRDKDSRWCKTSSSGILANSPRISARGNVGGLVSARVAAKQNCRVRYAARWHEIAMLHRLLETGFNRRPARGTLDIIDRAMREAAYESPSPGCLSRAQFISTLSTILDPCDVAALHRLYSSFDPDGTEKMRIEDILACLLVTHKPETEAFLEGLQQRFLGNLGAISSELHSDLTKGDRQVCWRFLRRLFKHFQAGSGLTIEEIERLFQVCAASDEDFLQMSTIFNAYTQEFSPTPTHKKVITESMFEQMFCTAFGLLDLFNTQMTAVQAIVKSTLPSN